MLEVTVDVRKKDTPNTDGNWQLTTMTIKFRLQAYEFISDLMLENIYSDHWISEVMLRPEDGSGVRNRSRAGATFLNSVAWHRTESH